MQSRLEHETHLPSVLLMRVLSVTTICTENCVLFGDDIIFQQPSLGIKLIQHMKLNETSSQHLRQTHQMSYTKISEVVLTHRIILLEPSLPEARVCKIQSQRIGRLSQFRYKSHQLLL